MAGKSLGTTVALAPAVRAIVLNGALPGDDGLTPIESAVTSMVAAGGWSVERIEARRLFVAYCKGCFNCWVRTPGLCRTRDMADGVLRSLARSQLAVLLSPITFGGYSSEIKKVLDRSIGLVSPHFTRLAGEIHHRPRYACAPALLAVGVTADRDPREAEIFARLVARNAINLHAPASFTVIVSRDDRPEQIRQAIRCGLTHVTARRGAA
jgi:hypothetical protein